jgi:RNA polymerase sigma-70 factor (ECF subfamily)
VGSRISRETAEAVGGLFRVEAAGLFGYARTLPNVSRADAEDLVQVTFQTAAMEWERQLCCLDPESRRRWLYRVLRNKAIDQWRTGGSRLVLSEQVESMSGPRQETCRNALASIVVERCWDRIAKMPAARQRVAFLRWGEEWSSAEVAELLGVSQSTVRAHLKLARDELAEEIGPDVPFADSGEDSGEGVAW